MSLTKVMEEVRISGGEPPTCLQAVDRWLQTQSDQTKDYDEHDGRFELDQHA
jgi:hypothetical protein